MRQKSFVIHKKSFQPSISNENAINPKNNKKNLMERGFLPNRFFRTICLFSKTTLSKPSFKHGNIMGCNVVFRFICETCNLLTGKIIA